jgi:hypothetical protein
MTRRDNCNAHKNQKPRPGENGGRSWRQTRRRRDGRKESNQKFHSKSCDKIELRLLCFVFVCVGLIASPTLTACRFDMNLLPFKRASLDVGWLNSIFPFSFRTILCLFF